MKNQTKTLTKKTELVFTTIEIERRNTIYYGVRYLAKFKKGTNVNNLEETKAEAKGIQSLLKLVSVILDCEIDERHYIIK